MRPEQLDSEMLMRMCGGSVSSGKSEMKALLWWLRGLTMEKPVLARLHATGVIAELGELFRDVSMFVCVATARPYGFGGTVFLVLFFRR